MFQSTRRFGVEIEVGSEVKKNDVKFAIEESMNQKAYVSRYALSNNNKYWHIKDDASCGIKGRKGPKGVEIASFVGSGLSDIDNISEVAVVLEGIGCKINDNCGFHVHVEVNDLSLKQVVVLMAHWIKIEKILSMTLPVRRINNEHCKFVCNPFDKKKAVMEHGNSYTLEQIWECVCPKNLSYYDNDDRRFNLNLVNLVRSMRDNTHSRRTLELRWPEGTLNAVDIRCWVKLFIMFIENCKDRSVPFDLTSYELEKTLECFGLDHYPECFFIYSDSIQELKTWFLERILLHGIELKDLFDVENTIKRAKIILNKMWNPERKY
jgi:hypothetical protein